MYRPLFPPTIDFSRTRVRNSISPVAHGRCQHAATPTISLPLEYASREGSLPSPDEDSIEAVTSSKASSCDEKHSTGSSWEGSLPSSYKGSIESITSSKASSYDENHSTGRSRDGKPEKKQVEENSPTPEKLPESKDSKKQRVEPEPEPAGIQIRPTILQLLRKTPWGWLLLALLVILLFILIPILWIDAYHAGYQGAAANLTSTVTVTISSATFISTVSNSAVLETPPPTPTSSTTIPTSTRIGGFAAAEYDVDDYGDLGVALFSVDDNGNIKKLDSDPSTTNGWKNAGTVNSNVRVGSAVSYTYVPDPMDSYLFFVGEDLIIQDLSDFWDWGPGTLSSLQLRTSESMNFIACAPWTTKTGETNNLAEIYLFYNSTDGHVRIAELSNGQWLSSPDTPFSVSAGFIGCDSDYYGNLLAYVVDRNRQLEQWSLKKDLTEPWNSDDGPYLPQTLIYSVKASKNSQGRSHIFLQDPENMIVRLDTTGLGTNTTVAGKANIALAVAGTRMTASGDRNSTVTLYYQTNGTEMWESSMTDDAVTNAVVKVGNAPVQSELPFGSGAGKLETAVGMRLVLCLLAALYLVY